MARGLLLCLVALAVAAAPARGAGWAPLRPVGYGIENDNAVVVADLTPSGAATVLWRGMSEGHQAILAAFGTPGGAFTPPVVVSRGSTNVGRPALAVSPGGIAVATWSQNGSVMAAVRSSGGTWADPEPVADAPDLVPSVAIGDDGKAIVTWVGDGVWGLGPQASWRVPGGVWSASEYIVRYPGAETQVGIDAKGNATVLWLRSPSQSDPPSIVTVTERPAGGEWSSPAQTWGTGHLHQLAVARSGAAAVTWEAGPGVVMAAVRPPGSSWSAAENTHVQLGDYSFEVPDVAVDGAGRAIVVAPRLTGGADFNQRPAFGAWPDDVQRLRIPYATENSAYPAAVANGRGSALISWVGDKDPHPVGGGGTPIVYAATQSAGGSWTQPLEIANPGGTVAADVDEADDGLVCWRTRTPTAAIQCRVHDATPPRLLDIAVPATAVAERAVSFGVRPVDSFSALGTTTWNFGDGTSVTGTRPTHTYAAGGRYTVRVTGRDAQGNATSAQRVITVAPAPPRITSIDARFRRPGFHRSHLSDNARVLVSGTITAPLRVSFRLTGPMRPRAERRTVALAERHLDAGAFSKAVPLPRPLAAKLLPGKYEVELTGPGLAPAVARLKLRAPPQGVVMTHRISTSRTGPNLLRVTDAERLWATFTFAPGAAAKRDLRAVWHAPNRAKPVGSFPVKRAFSWWGNPNGLAKGRWRCALVARGRVVDSVSILVG